MILNPHLIDLTLTNIVLNVIHVVLDMTVSRVIYTQNKDNSTDYNFVIHVYLISFILLLLHFHASLRCHKNNKGRVVVK
jgi:hypothetical protein